MITATSVNLYILTEGFGSTLYKPSLINVKSVVHSTLVNDYMTRQTAIIKLQLKFVKL